MPKFIGHYFFLLVAEWTLNVSTPPASNSLYCSGATIRKLHESNNVRKSPTPLNLLDPWFNDKFKETAAIIPFKLAPIPNRKLFLYFPSLLFSFGSVSWSLSQLIQKIRTVALRKEKNFREAAAFSSQSQPPPPPPHYLPGERFSLNPASYTLALPTFVSSPIIPYKCTNGKNLLEVYNPWLNIYINALLLKLILDRVFCIST